jgi:hypothetical protein
MPNVGDGSGVVEVAGRGGERLEMKLVINQQTNM